MSRTILDQLRVQRDSFELQIGDHQRTAQFIESIDIKLMTKI